MAAQALQDYLREQGYEPHKLQGALALFLAEYASLLEADPADIESVGDSYQNHLVFDSIAQFAQLLKRPL
jgi:hypothetical protein